MENRKFLKLSYVCHNALTALTATGSDQIADSQTPTRESLFKWKRVQIYDPGIF